MRNLVRLVFIGVFILTISACNQSKTKDTGEIDMLFNKVYANLFDNHDSLKFYYSILEKKVKNGSKYDLGRLKFIESQMAKDEGKFNLALNIASEALELLKDSKDDSLIGKTLNIQGSLNRALGNYTQAITNYFNALEHFQKIKSVPNIVNTYGNLAYTYQTKEDIFNAKKYVQKALDLSISDEYLIPHYKSMHVLANIYGMSGNIDSALIIDNDAIENVYQKSPTHKLLSPFYNNKALCFVELKKFDSAAVYFQKSMYIDSINNDIDLISDSYVQLGKMKMSEGKNSDAIAYLTKAINISSANSDKSSSLPAWEFLSQVYENTGDLKNALSARKSYEKINNEMVSKEKEIKLQELETMYSVNEQRQKIQHQEQKLENQKSILFISIFSLLGLGAIIYQIVKRKRSEEQTRHANELFQQNRNATINILRAEEKERKRIAEELHDGVGQVMTAAWLNLQAVGKRLESKPSEELNLIKTVTNLVGESCAEIRTMSHQMHPNVFAKKGLVNAVREFTNQIDKDILKVNFFAEKEDFELDESKQIVLYRVIQECIQNALKHSKATDLDISFVSEDKMLDITIEDNGVGMNTSEIMINKGLGIKNILSRVQYLGGTVEWDGTDHGTIVFIHIPISYEN